ncbi:MAG TPA: phasin family protein [Roseiarcus sp.]|nr:phasin family protein [Roseiarcus sp.]
MKAGEKVTKEAAAQAENAGKAASGALLSAGRAATGALEAPLKAVQDYQAKLVQCFQANAEANLQLAQKLAQIRSPADFVETMTSHMRERVALMTAQAKELAALSQEATRSAVDALAHPRR